MDVHFIHCTSAYTHTCTHTHTHCKCDNNYEFEAATFSVVFGSAFLIGIKFLIKFFLRLQFSSRAHKTLYSSLLPPFSPSFLPTLYSSLPSFIPPSLPCVSLSLPPFLPLFSLPSETWLRIHLYHYIHVDRVKIGSVKFLSVTAD